MPEGSPVAEEGRTGLSGSDSEEESGGTGSGVAESGGAGAAESAAAADGQDEQAEPPAGARRQAVGGGSGGDDEDGERESGAHWTPAPLQVCCPAVVRSMINSPGSSQPTPGESIRRLFRTVGSAVMHS